MRAACAGLPLTSTLPAVGDTLRLTDGTTARVLGSYDQITSRLLIGQDHAWQVTGPIGARVIGLADMAAPRPEVRCPECAGRLRKLYSGVGIVFKGSGFYRTDSRASATSSSTPSGKDGAAESPAKSDSTTKDSSSKDSATTKSEAPKPTPVTTSTPKTPTPA